MVSFFVNFQEEAASVWNRVAETVAIQCTQCAVCAVCSCCRVQQLWHAVGTATANRTTELLHQLSN